MPNFEVIKPRSCLKKTHTIKAKPFSLHTDERGLEKKIKFEELITKQLKN